MLGREYGWCAVYVDTKLSGNVKERSPNGLILKLHSRWQHPPARGSTAPLCASSGTPRTECLLTLIPNGTLSFKGYVLYVRFTG